MDESFYQTQQDENFFLDGLTHQVDWKILVSFQAEWPNQDFEMDIQIKKNIHADLYIFYYMALVPDVVG